LIVVSVLFVLLFCMPHKEVYAELDRSITKKVTAIVKFAKAVMLRAKNLNIAIKPLYHTANEIVCLLIFLIHFQ